MQRNTQDRTVSRTELLQSILGQAHLGMSSPVPPQPLCQGYEIYTGLDYSLKTTVTTNTVSARNA